MSIAKRIILLKDKDFNKLKNNHIDNLARLYGINAMVTDNFSKKNFKKNDDIDFINYRKFIYQYLREKYLKGNFIKNDNLILQ